MSTAFSAMQGEVIRVTELDEAGQPTGQVGVSAGFTRVQASTTTESGSTTTVKNAGGDICTTESSPDMITGADLTIDFCKVDPALFALMSGARAVTDCDDEIAGTAQGTETPDGGFALEIWANKGVGTSASGDGWYYTVYPNVSKGALGGSLTWEDGPQTYTLTTNASPSSAWKQGPYGVIPSAGSTGAVINCPPEDDYLPDPSGDPDTPVALCDPVLPDEFQYSVATKVRPPEPADVTTAVINMPAIVKAAKQTVASKPAPSAAKAD